MQRTLIERGRASAPGTHTARPRRARALITSGRQCTGMAATAMLVALGVCCAVVAPADAAVQLKMGARGDVSSRAAWAVGISKTEVQSLVQDKKSVLHAAHAEGLERGVHTLTPIVEAKRGLGRSAQATLKKSTTAGIGARPALFYVDVGLGSPTQTFRVDLDTGSSTLAVPSSACSNCIQHCNSPFDHSSSSTWQSIGCTSSSCCSSQWYSCDNSCAPSPYSGLCGFQTRYGDGSGIAGVWGKDKVTFAGSTVDLNFGVFTQLLNDKTFMPYAVDGILGIADSGLNYNSQGGTSDTIMDALKSQTGMAHIFSMCFGSKGGVLTLGEADTAHMSGDISYSDAIIDYGYWGIGVADIAVGGTSMQLTDAAAGQTIVDSGTTLWLMDSTTYSRFTSALLGSCTDTCNTLQALMAGYCVQVSSSLIEQLPEISVTFSEGGVATLQGGDYLRQGLCVGYESLYILGVADGGDINIMGITFMSKFTWVFDKESKQIGFAEMTGCNAAPSGMDTCGSSDGWGSSLGTWDFGTVDMSNLWERTPQEYVGLGVVVVVGIVVILRSSTSATSRLSGPRTPRRRYLNGKVTRAAPVASYGAHEHRPPLTVAPPSGASTYAVGDVGDGRNRSSTGAGSGSVSREPKPAARPHMSNYGTKM